MIARPAEGEYAEYYKTYIDKVPDTDLEKLLRINQEATIAFMKDLEPAIWEYRYAPGKWTVKEVINHIVDTERVMAYRALRIMRGDKTALPGFHQDEFVKNLGEELTVEALLDDYNAVRNATLSLLQQLTSKNSKNLGIASDHPVSSRALFYIIAGHEIHHLEVLRSKYSLV